jgi:hypothetical protein
VAELFRHAVAGDHGTCDVGDAPQIVRGAGGEMVEHNQFRGATAEQYRHLVLQFFARHKKAVFRWPLDGVAERAQSRGMIDIL